MYFAIGAAIGLLVGIAIGMPIGRARYSRRIMKPWTPPGHWWEW